MDRERLQERLVEIEASLPLWLAAADDKRDFWSDFADEANQLSKVTEPSDKDFLREQLDAMLRKLGLLRTMRALDGDA